MDKVILAVTSVTGDESCFSLMETNRLSPESRGPFRYQKLMVVRNDRLAVCEKKMGLASDFPVRQFVIYGGSIDEETGNIYIEHSVDEMLEMANQMRETPPFDIKDLIGRDNVQIH